MQPRLSCFLVGNSVLPSPCRFLRNITLTTPPQLVHNNRCRYHHHHPPLYFSPSALRIRRKCNSFWSWIFYWGYHIDHPQWAYAQRCVAMTPSPLVAVWLMAPIGKGQLIYSISLLGAPGVRRELSSSPMQCSHGTIRFNTLLISMTFKKNAYWTKHLVAIFFFFKQSIWLLYFSVLVHVESHWTPIP